MEKCTYCTRRTRPNESRWNAGHVGGRDGGGQLELPNGDAAVPIADGTLFRRAVALFHGRDVFGDLRDENSRVAKLFRNERTYQMLEELMSVPEPNTSPKSETRMGVAPRGTATVIMATATTATTAIMTTMVTITTITERGSRGLIPGSRHEPIDTNTVWEIPGERPSWTTTIRSAP